MVSADVIIERSSGGLPHGKNSSCETAPIWLSQLGVFFFSGTVSGSAHLLFPTATERSTSVFRGLGAVDRGRADVHLSVPDLVDPAHIAAAQSLATMGRGLGCSVRITTNLDDPGRVAEALGLAVADNAMGLISVGPPAPASLMAAVPTVHIGEVGSSPYPTVHYDQHAAARLLIDHLMLARHHDVLLVVSRPLDGRADDMADFWLESWPGHLAIESAEDRYRPHLDTLLREPSASPFSAVVVDNDDLGVILHDRVWATSPPPRPEVYGFGFDDAARVESPIVTVSHLMHERLADALGALRGDLVPPPRQPVLRLPCGRTSRLVH